MVIMTSLLLVYLLLRRYADCFILPSHIPFFPSSFYRTRREIIIVSIIDLAAFMQSICNMVFIERTLSFFITYSDFTDDTIKWSQNKTKHQEFIFIFFSHRAQCKDGNGECARLALQRRWQNGTEYFLYLGWKHKKKKKQEVKPLLYLVICFFARFRFIFFVLFYFALGGTWQRFKVQRYSNSYSQWLSHGNEYVFKEIACLATEFRAASYNRRRRRCRRAQCTVDKFEYLPCAHKTRWDEVHHISSHKEP